MISSATTVHQDGHGAEVRHSPQGRGRIDRLRMAPHGLPAGGWSATPAGHAIVFGPFRLFPTRRLLLKGESRFGSAAGLSTSLSLWSSERGELVSKDELMARVWPNTFVEESNLKVQVAGLRRVLGDRRGSRSVSGHDFRPRLPLRGAGHLIAEGLATRAERAHNLPAPDRAHVRPHRSRDRAHGPAVAPSPRYDRGPRRHR